MAYSRFLIAIVTAAVVHLHYCRSTSTQDICGRIGAHDVDDRDTQFQVNRTEMFYLDLNHSACCSGNITSWRVCYYGPSSGSEKLYHVKYAVYRRSNQTEEYVQVPDSPTFNITLTNREGQYSGPISEGFNCHDEFLDEPFTIEEGDVIGACVVDPNSPVMRQLNIISRVNEQPHASLPLHGIQEHVQPCEMGTIPTRIMISQLTAINSTRLYLSANIRSSE